MLDFLKKNSFTLLYTFFLGLMPLLVSSSISYWVITHEQEIQAFTFQNWTIAFIIACFTMAFALTPTTFIALLSGYFLGWKAFLPIAISYWIASFLGFKTAQMIDGGRFLKILSEKPKVKQILENLQKDEFKIILLARLSPVLPFAVTNVLFSFSGTKLRNFLTAGFLGMLPRTILSIWIGTQAQEIKKLIEHPSEGSLSQILILGLIGGSILGLGYFVKKAVEK
ncbi:VTT domain-containing protein [Arcicella sp. LKC2W]|uniref:TVP38/TMEM64 family protein n=1 Tax=Arcicella sp. LKC2W TaxID=2984198 RepID=UPI002B1F1C9A|nr:VTT domain-containing protein [Arcicella sp. LKC2W]MEA5457933.1 VTT domain-containing protein [Arcicella sp. LKC2W]